MSDLGPEDPACDPRCPRKVTYDSVVLARNRIRGHVNQTPCKYSKVLSDMFEMKVYLKLENLQITGSFKDRGAFNTISALLESHQMVPGVISASAGNHAVALANAGRDLGVPVTVIMPTSAPLNKVEACKRSNAEVILHGRHIGEAKKLGVQLSMERGYIYINGYDHPDIIAGQATVGVEIFEGLKHVDACIVPTGGGGLIAGVAVVASHDQPTCKIIGVESEASTGFTQALTAAHPKDTHLSGTLALGLAVPTSGVNALETAKDKVSLMLSVSEPAIVLAILKLFESENIVAEGAGAAGVAALMEGLLSEFVGKTVVIIVSGGNIDPTVVGEVIQRGLILERRLVKFEVTVSDVTSGLSTLSIVVANTGCSLKDIQKEVKWHSNENFIFVLKGLVETRNMEHFMELQDAIEKEFSSSCFYN